MARRHGGPTWEIPAAGLIHLLGFGAVVIGQMIHPAEDKAFKEPEAITVEMIGSDAIKGPVIQSAMRTPDAPSGVQSPTPPPPVNPNQMTMNTPDAPKKTGDPVADAQAMKDALDALKRSQALKDLDAPIGDVDRPATAPDGGSGDGATQAGINDPELKAWIKASETALNQNFHPLPAYCKANPNLVAVSVVTVDAQGKISGDPKIKKSSGNPSIDDACLRAFALTGRLPPTPAKYASGLTPNLNCKCPS